MPQRKWLFPMLGVNKNWAANTQPQFTTARILNVRPYDVLDNRARGGQRPGLIRLFSQQLGFVVSGERLRLETETNTTWDAEGKVMTGTGSLWDSQNITMAASHFVTAPVIGDTLTQNVSGAVMVVTGINAAETAIFGTVIGTWDTTNTYTSDDSGAVMDPATAGPPTEVDQHKVVAGDVVKVVVDTSRVNVALGFGYRLVASVDSDTQITLDFGISDGVGAPTTVDYEIGSGTTGIPVVDICQVTRVVGN